MKTCLIQMNTQDNFAENLAQAEKLLRAGIEDTRPDLVVLPELFTFLGGTAETLQAAAEKLPGGPAYGMLRNIALEYGVHLHAGSLAECDGDKLYNTTLVFGPDGSEVARYRKIHLFDVVTPDGIAFRESDTFGRGEKIVTYKVGQHTVGCSICYDLRFPELYAALAEAGADVIVAPAAFTLMTGKDHWELLARARAVETQTYVLAVNQVGTYVEDGSERASYGHTMVVDPWGAVLARAQAGKGWCAATLDFDYMHTVRANLPVQKHHVMSSERGAVS